MWTRSEHMSTNEKALGGDGSTAKGKAVIGPTDEGGSRSARTLRGFHDRGVTLSTAARDMEPPALADAAPVTGIVWAYRFRTDGVAELISNDKIEAALAAPGTGWMWLHLALAVGQTGMNVRPP